MSQTINFGQLATIAQEEAKECQDPNFTARDF